ncbi:hypothetical protein DFH08DRAFT_1080434 [Mycena albidolilacea]|uniref:F-box domain-containing protein n=1 Tax=Mycena albidolilacea TaxID=1033008 RepID=A0AAD7A1F7_9AGAR|nr:hypothetical protein DFH08DRAFT_1080434 [Mycena albidolilacea]
MQRINTFDLPNELWGEIFKNLPRHALCSVHGVSSLFHDISHPLFFRDFILDPDRHNLSSDEFIHWLNMYSSVPIAGHVRKLSISFQFGRWFRRSGRLFTGLTSPTPLFIPLLQTIPKFQNLRILECNFRFNSEVHFANLGLQDLPHLQELRIHGGKLYCPRDILGPKIRVAHFAYTAIPGIVPEQRPDSVTPRSFLSLLDPRALCALTLSPSYDSSPAAWLAYDQDLFATFRNLSTVNIGCDGPFLRGVHTFLAQLSALQHLTLTGSYRRYTEFTPTLGESLSAGLQSYTGPREYIPIFLPGTVCTRLAINACCTPDDLRRTWEDTPCTSAVTDLSLHFSLAGVCGWAAPHRLFALFPRLCTLRIVITDAPLDDDDSDVFDAAEMFDPAALSDLPNILGAVLRAPAALSLAVFEWDVHCDTVYILPDFEDLLDMLERSAPKVNCILFEGGVRSECSDDSNNSSDSFAESGSEGDIVMDD